MSKLLTPVATLHETAQGRVPILDTVPGWPVTGELDAMLQLLLDRDAAVASTAGAAATALSAIVSTGTNIKLTADGGLAVKMINRTGGVSVKGNVVCPYVGWVVTPGATTLSNMGTVVGASASNTHAGRLYLVVTLPAGAATVSAYKDEARQNKVAEGALADNLGGTVSLAQSNASGLSFDVDIEAGAVQDLTGPYVTLGLATGVEITDTSAINQTGVIYESGVADEAEVWVVVAGKAYVSMKANTAITCGSGLITSATSGGHVDELWEADATKIQRLVGWALERSVTAGAVGHVLCQLSLRGTWGVAA